jgi:phosphoglycerate dehydrogenase-like enzyme
MDMNGLLDSLGKSYHVPMNMPLRIAIPGDDPPQLQGSPHLDRLRERCDVILHTDRPADDAEKLRRVAGAICIINSRSAVKWPGHLLRQLPGLRMITVCGIGTDAIDTAAAKQLGIIVCNIPGLTAPIVAEHALALMLAAARRVCFQTTQLRRGVWKTPDNIFLYGKTLGILGAGPIGAQMGRLAHAIGMNVHAWTFNPTPDRALQLGFPFVPLDELLQTSDVVSIHVKLTDQTRNLIGTRELGLMKRGALLLNTARGAIVDTPALVQALNAGQLGGAGIDVYDIEPLPADHPLLTCEQVVLTPHVADQNAEGMEILNRVAVDNVLAFLDGTPCNRVV